MRIFRARVKDRASDAGGIAANPKKAPTLYFIIAVKLLKGILAFLAAVGIYSIHKKNLPDIFQHVLEFFRIDPERKFFHDLALRIREITPANVRWVARGMMFYSLFSLVEGFGLMFRVTWIGWLAIGESAFFIPIEVYELMKHVENRATPRQDLFVLIVMGFNILIVWYLFRNRKRLFRHHHD